MATTVIAAFNEFMKDTVNLEKADTDDARASRDWLIGKRGLRANGTETYVKDLIHCLN